MAKTKFKVQTQLVTIQDPSTHQRIRKARKTRFRTFDLHEQPTSNVRDAIRYVTKQMLTRHIGGIVIVRPVTKGYSEPVYNKIFQAKWGTDRRPFVRFDGVAGEFWRRQLLRSNPQLVQRLEAL